MADTVPIPLARPDNTTAGIDATGGSWINDLGSWLDGTVSSILDTGKSVASNWFDYLTTTNQYAAQQAQAQQQAQQQQLLASLKSGTTLYPYGTATLGTTATASASMPAWLLPVGLVLAGGFALLMVAKK